MTDLKELTQHGTQAAPWWRGPAVAVAALAVVIVVGAVVIALSGGLGSGDDAAGPGEPPTSVVPPDNVTTTVATPPTETTARSTSTTLDPYPNRAADVARAERFLDALYSFDQDAMLATLAPGSRAEEFVTYYLGFAKGANYDVTFRQPCVFDEGGVTGKVTCVVTVENDLTRTLGVTESVSAWFTFYATDQGITLVEEDGAAPTVGSDEALADGVAGEEMTAGLKWVYETYPELRAYEGACWKIFDGGPTPEACAIALVAALEQYASQ